MIRSCLSRQFAMQLVLQNKFPGTAIKVPAVKMASCIPETMKALVKQSEGHSYDYVNVPVPKPKDEELLIRVSKVAICGLDIALYQWNKGILSCGRDLMLENDCTFVILVARVIAAVLFTPSHEMVGEVSAWLLHLCLWC